MMDLKEIIRWFLPCFHLLLVKKRKMSANLTIICLCLFFNFILVNGSSDSNVVVNRNKIESTKNVGFNVARRNEENAAFNQSDYLANERKMDYEESRSLQDTSAGRTFGRPFMKKMMAGLIPIVFQIGAASTWAVIAAIVGVKTLAVTLFILKLLLLAGAAKFGALFANKGHQPVSHGWQPPSQKEIHLHIHNGHHGHEHYEEHAPISSWSREGYPVSQDSKNINVVLDPYRGGPQTISTPYGNYVKIDPLASTT